MPVGFPGGSLSHQMVAQYIWTVAFTEGHKQDQKMHQQPKTISGHLRFTKFPASRSLSLLHVTLGCLTKTLGRSPSRPCGNVQCRPCWGGGATALGDGNMAARPRSALQARAGPTQAGQLRVAGEQGWETSGPRRERKEVTWHAVRVVLAESDCPRSEWQLPAALVSHLSSGLCEDRVTQHGWAPRVALSLWAIATGVTFIGEPRNCLSYL